MTHDAAVRQYAAALARSQAAARIGVWTWTVATGSVTWSPELLHIAGYDASFSPTFESMVGIVHEDDQDRVRTAFRSAVRDGSTLSYSARIVRPDGAVRWVEAVAASDIADGVVTGYAGTIADVTPEYQAVAALRESEARYRTIVETAREGIWSIDAEGITTYVNARMAAMLGYQVEEMVGRSLFDFLDEAGRAVATAVIQRQREGYDERFDFRFRRKDGSDVWTLINTGPVLDDAHEYAGAIALVTDITDRKAAEDDLAHSATHDHLTGLPNRLLLLDRIEVALNRAARTSTTFAVLLCDLDHFKFVNESLGHDTGDEVLVAVATRLAAVVRPSDTIARTGGDEFVLCCEEVDGVAGAEAVAARIERSLGKPVVVGGREIFLSASIGIRLANPGADEATDLLRDADAAMYRAKESGRGSHAVFDEALRTKAERRLEIEAGLHHALRLGELRVHYQPTVSVADGRIAGVEALVRWQHGDGLRGPGEFIGVAEDTGLIVPIGLWVLDQACRTAVEWDALGAVPLAMAVNVSPRQLHSTGFVDTVAGVLATSGLAPGRLCLEITESVLIEDATTVPAVLAELKALGVRLAIDDFGTGYSSLSYLRQFPIDVLKIDKSFVAQLGTDPEATAIVTSIVHLAKAMNLELVAEGVETREQLGQLELLGCDFGQGYFWSRPVPADELAIWLRLTAEAPLPEPPAGPRAGTYTVVVADDEETHRVAVRRILEGSGRFTVVAEAADGQQAVEYAERERPDLVLLDLSMPKMGGLEALPRILARSPGTKVALLSGHIGRAPLAAGASVQLQKGTRPADIVENLLLVLGAAVEVS